ncbi:hypothetical protein NXS19_012465 [Fusarium pseudograminearum]|nr:hypothetical protein NXS19_012465 [Fusarium pseudograminearum]
MRLRGRGTARLGGTLTSEALEPQDPEIRCPIERNLHLSDILLAYREADFELADLINNNARPQWLKLLQGIRSFKPSPSDKSHTHAHGIHQLVFG